MYQTSGVRNQNLTVNGLFENNSNDTPTPGNLGIRQAFVVDGDDSNTAIDGFAVDTFSPHVENSFIKIETAGTVRLSNVNIRVQNLLNAGAVFFEGSSALSIDGEISTRDNAKLNLDDLASFNGELRVNDFSAMPKPTSGSYIAYDKATESIIMAGDQDGNTRLRFYNSVAYFKT